MLLLAPLVFFGLAELSLAIVGFGGWPPLFVDAPSAPGFRQANSQVMQRYFPGRPTKLGIDPIVFEKEKPAGAIRLVVQGGSTAAGFPYGRWAGLAGMLGDRLEAVYPERDIEVVTTALAAVNTYTLLDFVDEIIEIEPDAVLIYAGHNEYVGIFGAGSALTARRSRAATELHLRLSRFRVYQLLSSAFSVGKGLRDAVGGSQDAPRDTLMAQAASSPEIPVGSEIYREGARQFESNLEHILERYERAGIPVYVGTLASNERDQAPFAGGVLDESRREAFSSLLASAEGAYQAGDLVTASERATEATTLDPEAANAWFLLGRIEEAAGRFERAQAAYELAKDFDRLRFRAPSSFNRTIRERAAAHGATVVEVRANLVARSPHGVIGKESMLEHLHPNANGYFYLADAFYRALSRDAIFGPAQVDWSLEDARRDMPITEVDRILAAQAVREIRNDYPFRPDRVEVPFPEPKNEVMKIAQRVHEDPAAWLDAMEGLLQFYVKQGRTADAIVVARMTAQAFPWEPMPNVAAAKLLLQAGRYRQAARYFERGLTTGPEDPATLGLLARTRLLLGEREKARAVLERLREIDPSNQFDEGE